MELPDSVKYMIEALRTAPSSKLPTSQKPSNPNLGPIEQRRDGYRQYLNEFRGGSQEGEPDSYEQWIAKQE